MTLKQGVSVGEMAELEKNQLFVLSADVKSNNAAQISAPYKIRIDVPLRWVL